MWPHMDQVFIGEDESAGKAVKIEECRWFVRDREQGDQVSLEGWIQVAAACPRMIPQFSFLTHPLPLLGLMLAK